MQDKICIITGATKGMGYAMSEHFLSKGAKVVMVYGHDADRAAVCQKELGQYENNFLLLQADITDSNKRQFILYETLKQFQRVDVLVNNAGVAAKAGFLKENESDFDFILDINLKAPIFLAQLIAKQMIEQAQGGSIINISSVCGHLAMGGIAYDAAKAGIIRATEAMANALGQYNIRVNSISPGTHKTEMNRAHWEKDTEVYRGMVQATALKRAAEASEIAGTVEFLATQQSCYITGTDILVDGGYLRNVPGR